MNPYGATVSSSSSESIGGQKKFAAPLWRLLEAITRDKGQWWVPAPGETIPETLVADESHVVMSSPWQERSSDRLSFELSAGGAGEGSCVRWTLTYEAPLPVDPNDYRHRINRLIGSALRDFVDGGG